MTSKLYNCTTSNDCNLGEYCNFRTCCPTANCVKDKSGKCKNDYYKLWDQFFPGISEKYKDYCLENHSQSLNDFKLCFLNSCKEEYNNDPMCYLITYNYQDLIPTCQSYDDCNTYSSNSGLICNYGSGECEQKIDCDLQGEINTNHKNCQDNAYCNISVPSHNNQSFPYTCDPNPVKCNYSVDCKDNKNMNNVYCDKTTNTCKNIEYCDDKEYMCSDSDTHICFNNQCINKKQCTTNKECNEYDNMMCNEEIGFCVPYTKCSNNNCPQGLNCGPENYCINDRKCLSDDDCECGQICNIGDKEGGEGVCINGQKCVNNSDCTEGENKICSSGGTCINPKCMCEGNIMSNCNNGDVCSSDGNCYQCITTDDCTGGKVCKYNLCSNCVNNGDCSGYEICEKGLCVSTGGGGGGGGGNNTDKNILLFFLIILIFCLIGVISFLVFYK